MQEGRQGKCDIYFTSKESKWGSVLTLTTKSSSSLASVLLSLGRLACSSSAQRKSCQLRQATMTARCRNCTHHKLYMQPSSSGYSAQSSLVGTRLVTENMRTSLSTTCTKTWREGTRYETHKSLEVGNFLGCVNIVKAFRPLSGKVSRVHTNKTHDIKQEAQDGKKKVILRVMHNKKPTTLGFVSAWLSESFFSSCLVLPVCPLLRGCFQFSRTVDSTAAPS